MKERKTTKFSLANLLSVSDNDNDTQDTQIIWKDMVVIQLFASDTLHTGILLYQSSGQHLNLSSDHTLTKIHNKGLHLF